MLSRTIVSPSREVANGLVRYLGKRMIAAIALIAGVAGTGLQIFLAGWQQRHPTMDDRLYWGLVGLGSMLMIFGVGYGLWRVSKHLVAISRRGKGLKQVKPSSHFQVVPYTRSRNYDSSEHLIWAELSVENLSGSVLKDVSVRVVSHVRLMERQDDAGTIVPGEYVEFTDEEWTPITVLWSQRDSIPPHVNVDIAPKARRSSIIAFSDDSNGPPPIFNSNPSTRVLSIDGARIEIELSASNSSPWRGTFFLQCHGQYVTGNWSTGLKQAIAGLASPAQFQFEPWNKWLETHRICKTIKV